MRDSRHLAFSLYYINFAAYFRYTTMRHDDFIIAFESARLGYGKVVIENTEGFGISRGITAIIGRNGSGKTTLGTILEKGRYAYGNRLRFANPDMAIKMLSFSDIHSLSGMEAQYYSQRMESTMNDMVPTVAEIVGERINTDTWASVSESLGLHDVADKKINYLSSGELRKLIIINALVANPGMLILDNPYIGLDAPSRSELNSLLVKLESRGVSVVLLVCDPSDIPDFADSVISLEKCRIESLESLEDFRKRIESSNSQNSDCDIVVPERHASHKLDFEIAFEIRKGHIRYGDRQILKDIDWCVRRGECWALTGPNGSGKSLLLSMVCADNPQSYSNDITLFSRKRGSGESIWEIKDAIGYVSPEMQLFFKSGSCVRDIVIQGLRNSLNRYAKPDDEEIKMAESWLDLLQITHLASRKFSELSAGEQRLVLVARALIKQPELLVLDEPLHGLDDANKERVKKIVNEVVTRNNSSLIFVTHYTSEIPACITNTKTLVKLP